MTKHEFFEFLRDNGFPEPTLVTQPPNGNLETHAHPFEVYALIIEGFILIEINGETSRYDVGDVFHLGYLQNHSESYGPIGVKYLACRINP